ncbi:hypothetical protein MNG63_003313 [Salmonella enterica]|nr:hypothetical protein [Salmonella enterica]
MVLKHRELNELDEPFEFKMVDEVEDFDDEEKANGSEDIDESLKARRKANITYQNTRKEQLKKVGEHQIQIRLDDETFQKLCDLCNMLGYKTPKKGMRNLVELYSTIFKYLLRTNEEGFEYIPKKEQSIKILNIYKYVDHLKHEKQFPKDVIISELEKRNIKIPVQKVNNSAIVFLKGGFLNQYFDKDKVIKVLKMVDENQ